MMARRLPSRLVGVSGLVTSLVLALAFTAMGVSAHGGGTLTVEPTSVEPGKSITIQAQGVGSGEVFTLRLVGMTYQATLGTATGDDNEQFQASFTVPADAPEGSYQIEAITEDGDQLTAELSISPSASAPSTPAEASAASMNLDRSKPPLELASILIVLALAAGVGVVLIRGRG